MRKNPPVCNEELNHEEKEEGSQINVSSYFSNSDFFCQEQSIFLFYFIEKQNDISFEMHEKKQVINSEILNEVVDVSFENCHKLSFQGSFEFFFVRVQKNVHFEQPCHGKQIT